MELRNTSDTIQILHYKLLKDACPFSKNKPKKNLKKVEKLSTNIANRQFEKSHEESEIYWPSF